MSIKKAFKIKAFNHICHDQIESGIDPILWHSPGINPALNVYLRYLLSRTAIISHFPPEEKTRFDRLLTFPVKSIFLPS